MLEQNGEVIRDKVIAIRFRCIFWSCFSWKCFRLQFLDSAAATKGRAPVLSAETAKTTGPVTKTTDWFGEADDWGEETDDTLGVKSPITAMEEEENGNVVLLDNGKSLNQNLNLSRLTLEDGVHTPPAAAVAASPSPTSEASEPSSSCSSAATPDPSAANANAVAAASARVTGEIATAEIEEDQASVFGCKCISLPLQNISKLPHFPCHTIINIR